MPDKYARTEFERRFLLRSLPPQIDPAGFTRIIDRYLAGSDLRLRRMETPDGQVVACKLAKKFKAAAAGPYQTTITNLYLSEREYALLEKVPGEPLVKKRYPFPVGGRTYSIDAFEGQLAGLLLAEIEAMDLESLLALPAPPGAIQEVSADPFFLGGSLVRTEAHALEDHLRRYF